MEERKCEEVQRFLNGRVIAATPWFTAFFTDFTAFFAARLVLDAEDRMEGER
jgi:hypothetical protein